MEPDELAAQIGVSRHGVDLEIKAGRIPHFRIGKRVFVPDHFVARLLAGEHQTTDKQVPA